MKIRLPSEQTHLLREVAKKHQIDVAPFSTADGTWEMPDDIRKSLIDAIASEFCASGLLPDSEPNPRGLVLEEILTQLNRPNITRKNEPTANP